MKKILTLIITLGTITLIGTYAFLNNDSFNQQSQKIQNSIKYDHITSSLKPEQFLNQAFANNTEISEKNNTELTIYNNNLALIKENRILDLKKGINQVKYTDVPKMIDSTSVIFTTLDDANTSVLEQSYAYDLVSTEKLLEKYIDQEIKISVPSDNNSYQTIEGKLLSYQNGVLLETQSGIESFKDLKSLSFPELKSGLITKPTLIWAIETNKSGEQNTQTSYLSGGINWNASYIAEVDKNDQNINLKGWVTINNESGTYYPDSKLKLVAGEVNRVSTANNDYRIMEEAMYDSKTLSAPQGAGFAEESFFEYHLYTLNRKTNINNNESKQISLLEAKDIPVKKEFVYDYQMDNENIIINLNLENKEEKGLGIPLPKGIIRAYKADSDSQLQFIGEDYIDHTAKNEDIEIFLGKAFDIKAKRKLEDSESFGDLLDFGDRCTAQKITVELKNHKTEDITIKVKESANYYQEFEISNASIEPAKEDAFSYYFYVKVKADETETLSYNVKYCY